MNGRDIGFALSLHSLKWNLWRNFIRLCLPGRAVMWERASLLPPSAASSSRTAISPHRSRHKIWRSIHLPLPKAGDSRAQAVQAEAAGVPCHTDMNPLLLKPQSDHTSQVVLNGRPIGNRNAYEYFRKEDATSCAGRFVLPTTALPLAIIPLCWKAREASPKSICGIPDLVNLPMALHAGADVILVGDIDRGRCVCQRLRFADVASSP